jgi:predicted transcriptional regulator
MSVDSCEFSSSSESSFSFEVQNGDDQEGFVVTGNPSQMLDISNDLLDYLKSAHINNENDAEDFENAINEVKEDLKEVSDSINARIEKMDPQEKGALIDETNNVSEQLEANNPSIIHEIDRLVKEAKEQGITLAVDL